MNQHGASVFEIKAQSRHKQIKTLERYIQPNDEQIRETYDKTTPKFNSEEEPEPKTKGDPDIEEISKKPELLKEILGRLKELEQKEKDRDKNPMFG
jgi:hypothetical protein